MLAERLNALLSLLGPSNAELARWAALSPSTISRLKGGSRVPEPGSPTVGMLADGIYSYADFEGRLDELARAVGAPATTRAQLCPALAAWLFGAGEDTGDVPPVSTGVAREARAEARAGEFGRRLDQAMGLVGATNSWLARQMSVDPSLVSRMRHGQRYPRGDEYMQRAMAQALVEAAKAKGKVGSLARLTEAGGAELTADTLRAWLFDDRAADYALAVSLVEGIGSWEPPSGVGGADGGVPAFAVRERYWGAEGMREAVARLLADAASTGAGELLLYSDEPMGWLTDNAAFFRDAAALLARAALSGLRVRIAHNFDRGLGELVEAIRFWMPLYMTGAIEPFSLHGTRGERFFNTALVAPGRAAVLGAGPKAAGGVAWHDYALDTERLTAAERGVRLMLAGASPILKAYAGDWEDHVAELLGVSDAESMLVAAPSATGVLVGSGRGRVMAARECDPKVAFVFEEPRLVAALRGYLSVAGAGGAYSPDASSIVPSSATTKVQK